jgi:hypothetical protein
MKTAGHGGFFMPASAEGSVRDIFTESSLKNDVQNRRKAGNFIDVDIFLNSFFFNRKLSYICRPFYGKVGFCARTF